MVVIVSDWRCWFTFGVDDDGLVMVAKVNLATAPDNKYRKDYNVGAPPHHAPDTGQFRPFFFVLDLFFLCLHMKFMYIEMLKIHF